VETTPFWRPRFYYGNQHPIIETNILLWKHIEWEQRQFGNPDSTMETYRVGTLPIWRPRFYYGNQHLIMKTNILLWKHIE
jgi:hypothetical protein